MYVLVVVVYVRTYIVAYVFVVVVYVRMYYVFQGVSVWLLSRRRDLLVVRCPQEFSMHASSPCLSGCGGRVSVLCHQVAI